MDAASNALAIDRQFADAWTNLGVTLYEQKKLREAKDNYWSEIVDIQRPVRSATW